MYSRIKKFKITRRETYDEIINRVLDYFEKQNPIKQEEVKNEPEGDRSQDIGIGSQN